MSIPHIKPPDWAKVLEADETPFTTLLRRGPNPWSPPDFCIKEKKETVEPFFGWYQSLLSVIELALPIRDDDDDEWYEVRESEALTNLRRVAYDIGRQAYKEVPNPAYNEEECLAWKEDNVRTWTKVEWGPANIPPIEESVIITPDGPRVIDEGEEGL